MISQAGKSILEKFVGSAKALLMEDVTSLLQQYYGIWKDGHSIPLVNLTNQDTNILHTAKMLRERLRHIKSSLPEGMVNADKVAVEQLISEQAFTILNRFCALRMCEERELILPSVSGGYGSAGFVAYDSVAEHLQVSRYERYVMYIHSVFDELSIELPSVFNRYSPYGLVFPDELALKQLLDMLCDENLSHWYDDQNGMYVNFWKEDETLGWIFQYYNSLEERRRMREESAKPRNSREMAVRNQFFTPEYVVRFLTDNSLGRIWYEMTDGKSEIADKVCQYMVRRLGEKWEPRAIKEPTEILTLDPTCGSMHFGIYVYEVYEFIYMDAWDNHPELLHRFREVNTRESFRKLVPALILEYNIYGCEIDPRALQLAALSLWLRAQRSYSELGLLPKDRPLITRSNLVLAESMPGNKKLLRNLLEEVDPAMRRLINKVWDKMKFVGEAGLLFKMEKEIEDDIEYIRKNWSVVNKQKDLSLFDTEEEHAKLVEENKAVASRVNKEAKENFFAEVKEKLQQALQQISSRLSEEEDYENTLFTEDATRGFAFIELCQKRFDCIVMNPPFGEGSENTSDYLDKNYPAWCRNLVCAFFIRMKEMLKECGKVGAIFDRGVMFRDSYKTFRTDIIDYISYCADTGKDVLDASVVTSTMVLDSIANKGNACFFDLQKPTPENKNVELLNLIKFISEKENHDDIHICHPHLFLKTPDSAICYNFKKEILNLFENESLSEQKIVTHEGFTFVAPVQKRVFYENIDKDYFYKHVYGGSSYTLFYTCYRELVQWIDNGKIAKTWRSYRSSSMEWQEKQGVCYGKRGDIVDAHIFKKNMFFTAEGLALPNVTGFNERVVLSYINSIIAEYTINQYTGGDHKISGKMNQLPMPNYASHQSDIERIVNAIIDIKRRWFSIDETNLEYHGLIAQLKKTPSIIFSFELMQAKLKEDYEQYCKLVKENDDLWMDLANIDRDSDFRKTLNDYKQRRPYEELLSIDGASSQNVIDKKVMAQEILMELVGMAFGRWDIAYSNGKKNIPEFGDVFDALPFMPKVSLKEKPEDYPIPIPEDGILSSSVDSVISLSRRVSDVMLAIWGDQADEIEYELCGLIGCNSLQEYLEKATGFFDYHFKRYTKSRRKAPIYWPLSSEDGSITYWVYYPKFSKNTIPALILRLRQDLEMTRTAADAAGASHDKVKETELRIKQQQIEGFIDTLTKINAQGYVPNHDDGVPVTAAPLAMLFQHRGWRNECFDNLKKLEKGEYDWSHLAYSLYPARITEKSKKDWCMALTHGLEAICENKPKEKKPRKKKTNNQTLLDF